MKKTADQDLPSQKLAGRRVRNNGGWKEAAEKKELSAPEERVKFAFLKAPGCRVNGNCGGMAGGRHV
jgi:hypothetical protein